MNSRDSDAVIGKLIIDYKACDHCCYFKNKVCKKVEMNNNKNGNTHIDFDNKNIYCNCFENIRILKTTQYLILKELYNNGGSLSLIDLNKILLDKYNKKTSRSAITQYFYHDIYIYYDHERIYLTTLGRQLVQIQMEYNPDQNNEEDHANL
jgi:hypothetical protein